MNAVNEARLLLILLVVASVLLVAGWVMPLMTIKTLMFVRNTFSVMTGIYDLWQSQKYFLFLIISLFSVVFPLLKIGLLAAFILGRLNAWPVAKKLLHLAHEYGRWAMLDVMVVAVLLVTVKLGAIAKVEVHPGLYLFGGSVLLIMIITHRVMKSAMSTGFTNA